jgi:hypothetical protein
MGRMFEECAGCNILVASASGQESGVPDMQNVAHFEPVAWWWTRNQIGRDLRERYEVPKELTPKLLTLVGKLDDRDWLFQSVSRQDWLFQSVSRQDDIDLLGGHVQG